MAGGVGEYEEQGTTPTCTEHGSHVAGGVGEYEGQGTTPTCTEHGSHVAGGVGEYEELLAEDGGQTVHSSTLHVVAVTDGRLNDPVLMFEKSFSFLGPLIIF